MILDTALEVACRAADRARELAAAARDLTAESKSDGSPVTALDKSIETVVCEEIAAMFPDHAIKGEEYGDRAGSAVYEWFIDPIDGTISLVNRIPTFSTLIALCERGRPVVSVVDFPALGERYTAVDGRGARGPGGTLAVAETFDWHNSIVCHGDRYCFDASGCAPLYAAFAHRARLFRSYTDAFGHTLVARGAAALMIDPGMRAWDVAAPMLLVQEAGGKVILYRDPVEAHKFVCLAGNVFAVHAAQEMAAAAGLDLCETTLQTCL